jgi:hypothetical protein
MKGLFGAAICAASLFAVTADARVYYGGGHHTYSHGGHYAGGYGSSHRGGHYRNSHTGNHYGRHR